MTTKRKKTKNVSEHSNANDSNDEEKHLLLASDNENNETKKSEDNESETTINITAGKEIEETDDSSADDSTNDNKYLSLKSRATQLLSGDYVIQVHIIEGRELRGRGWDDMSDPVVQVQCLGKKQSTIIKKKCLNCVWDQVLFFEMKDLDAQRMNEGKCKLCVYDANTLLRDVQIGSYEFDLASIYFSSPDHEIYRQWIALSDMNEEYDGIQGYLLCSIVVLGPNDEQRMHADIEEDEKEMNLLSVLMPPEIEQIPYLLTISIYECKDLQTSDSTLHKITNVFSCTDESNINLCDLYVIIYFAGIKLQTEVRKGCNASAIEMLCELQIPVMEPIMAQAITIEFYDWNAVAFLYLCIF